MQVSVESTSALERKMTVEVPEERIQSEVDNRLKSLARTTRIDGFRPGKVPFNVVKKRYQAQVIQEVVGEVVQNTFYEAVTNEKLHPVGMPSIDPQPFEEGKGLSYTATFEVFPEVTVAPLDGVEIEKPVAEVTDADLDAMMEKIRAQRTVWAEKEGAAETGDRVVIDFKGTIDGEEFEGNSATQMPVELGKGRMIAGFEDQLIGVAAGEEKTLDLSFPEEYHFKKVAGKPVQFAVTVHKVEKAELPELNDEFAKEMGADEGGIAKLREQILESMKLELENALKGKVKSQVSEKLYEMNQVEVPAAMVKQEVEAAIKRSGMPEGAEIPDEQKQKLEEGSRKRVAVGLLFSEIVKNNSLSVPEERLRAEVEKVAASYEDSDKVVEWYFGDKSRLADVEAVVLEEMIVDWVLDNATVKEVQSSFDEVVSPQ